ncbi:hypothetical protein M446_6083 [Methylobacterium sp. 4-46]|uniref:sulfotransferase family protein n=1 Tax=unclassified Methylobacterium TaxID=2615210 RepID=UPI000152D411|nr:MULTISPECIES: sulfotransferase family protein [Methylobacterium]ACA20359.1 hypothetical protein M446_6083 [Methylobacterium sp. 4-46]WFT79530.1 sulfotransferase family protein [Methylobacterium nodulans]
MQDESSDTSSILSDEETLLLTEQAALVESGCIVDLRSCSRQSALALATGVARRPPQSRTLIYRIAPQGPHAAPVEGLSRTSGSDAPDSSCERPDPLRYIVEIDLDSRQAAHVLKCQVGLLFMCAGTGESGAVDDLRAWLPLIAPGARVIVHGDLDDRTGPGCALPEGPHGQDLRCTSASGAIRILEKAPPSHGTIRPDYNRAVHDRIATLAERAGYEPWFATARLAYGSYVSRRHKLVYIETPKVACTSLKSFFSSLEGVTFDPRARKPYHKESKLGMLIHQRKYLDIPTFLELTMPELDEILENRASWYRFAISRNPYSRLFSFFCSKILTNEPGYSELFDRFGRIGDVHDLQSHFSSFVTYLSDNFQDFTSREVHVRPQKDLLLSDLIKYNNIFKIEKFEELVESLALRLGDHSLTIPRENKSLIGNWSRFYEEGTATTVSELYRDDFAHFGYSCQIDACERTGRPDSEAGFGSDLDLLGEIVSRNEMIDHLYTYIL